MPRVRYEIAAKLDVRSPMHVGTGDGRQVASVRESGANTGPDVAAIVRDAAGAPYLPSASLKGLLRRLGEASWGREDARVVHLFGDHTIGKAGCVLVRGARLERPGNAAKMPFADDTPFSQQGLGPGVFVAARTAVDPAKGIAEDHKLHHAEMVAPGARFAVDLVVEARDTGADERASAAAGDLLALLHLLDGGAASALGRGTGDGNGRVKIVSDDVKVVRRQLLGTGALDRQDATGLWRKPTALRPNAGRTETLVLLAEGPFLNVDSSARPPPHKPGQERKAQLAAQRTSDDRPLILGSGVAGALRERGRWLSALSKHAGGRDLSKSVDRLFGTSDFKGLLLIEATCPDRPKLWTAASVKIDRFTGGPIQNALFHTEAFVGVRLTLALTLAARSPSDPVTETDEALFQALLADLRENGLMLGYGVNRGYGWFRVEEA